MRPWTAARRAAMVILALAALGFPLRWAANTAASPPAAIANPWAIRTGEATHYDPTVGEGNCSLPITPDRLVAAMNTGDYGLADYCGATVRINGPRGAVTVRIIDRCPGCAVGDIDLSPEAFSAIADLSAGRVPISWQLISPEGFGGPVSFRYKEGSSQWWAGVQVRNHRNAIARFEFRNAQGQFQAVNRVDYNYFIQAGGMGAGPLTFRVTDVYGNVLTESGIPLLESGETPGAQQFPYVPAPGTPTATPTSTAVPPTATPTRTPGPTATPTPPPAGCGTANIARNRPATASSQENASLGAVAAVDGNGATRWSSAWADPQWLQIDLGAVQPLCRVVLNWEAAYGSAYQIQVSNDANSWATLKTVSGENGGTDSHAVSGSGRFLRIYGTARATQWGYSLWEVEAYPPAGGATATPQPTATATPAPTATATPTRTP
ncbi:MAG TPA: expansin EXLX1 family cellulose-binding protein, partial [Herpetosiphonaceae bacterium]